MDPIFVTILFRKNLDETFIVTPGHIDVDIIIPWNHALMTNCAQGTSSAQTVFQVMLIAYFNKII